MGYRFEPMVSHLQSLKVGVRNKFLTPTNSHFIQFPITAIIESEIFPNIRPQGERINKKVNPFLNKRRRQVCWVENKKGKEKTDEGSSVLLYFVTEEGE